VNAVGHTSITAESVRARLQAMDDDALKRFGIAAAFMCSPEANNGKPPREAFVLQLREARAEWTRRHGTDDPPARS
jgi:hypothetical protein